MKTRKRIILFGLLFGVGFWVADSFVDLFFYESGLWDLMLLHVPPIELYTRSAALALFVALGAIMGRSAARRERAEEALARREGWLQLIMENSYDGINICAFDHETDHRTLVMCNDRYVEMSGYTREELMGAENLKDLTENFEQPPDILERYRKGLPAQGTASWIRPDGKENYYEWTSRALEIDGKLHIFGSDRDITERRRAEEERRKRAELQQVFLDALPPVAMLLRPHTREIVARNKAGQEVGAEPGKICFESWGQTDAPCPWCLAPEVWETGEARHLQTWGVGRFWDAHWIPVSDDLYLHYAYDITEQKRAEEERQKLETKVQDAQKLESLGVLAGGIAHDFNNLLMIMLGNADIALRNLSEVAPARIGVDEIKKAVLRASELTNQMLAYSGRGRFVVESLNFNEVIEEMGHLLQVSISKKVTLRYDLPGNLPAIEADAAQIRQIVMNLITNASEAIGDETGVVGITTGVVKMDRAYLSAVHLDEDLPEGRYVFVEVTDTGCGMDEETRSKLFDPFFTTKFTGRGLGMAAVLGIVRGHKGAIKVESEVGEGSTFRVLFPCGGQAAVTETAPGAERPETWRPSGTLLVVDDEEGVRKVVKEMLEEAGFDVLVAADGREAVDVFREYPGEIAAVLLDMTTPQLSGEDALRELRRIKPDVRVILSSGYDEQEVTDRFAGKHLAGFIQKPYEYEELVAKFRTALGAE